MGVKETGFTCGQEADLAASWVGVGSISCTWS